MWVHFDTSYEQYILIASHNHLTQILTLSLSESIEIANSEISMQKQHQLYDAIKLYIYHSNRVES